MSYSGAAQAKQVREVLGRALAALQLDPTLPPRALDVASNIAQAVGSLFVAENAPDDNLGKQAVRASLGMLGQALALMQQITPPLPAIEAAMGSLAQAMGILFPLTVAPDVAHAQPSPGAAPAAHATQAISAFQPAPVAQPVQPAQPTPAFQPAPAAQPVQPAQPAAPAPVQTFQPASSAPNATPSASSAPGSTAPTTERPGVGPTGRIGHSTLVFAEIPSPLASPSSHAAAHGAPAVEAKAAASGPAIASPAPSSAQPWNAPVAAAAPAWQQPALAPAAEPSQPTFGRAPLDAVPTAKPVVAVPQAAPAQPVAPAPQPSPYAAPAQPVAPAPQPSPYAAPAQPATPYVAPASVDTTGRPTVEANISVNTTANFWVGFEDEIAQGGVFVPTYEDLEPGTGVLVHVTLPAGTSFRSAAKVVFIRDPSAADPTLEPGLGLRFEALSPDHREIARQFFARRRPLFYDLG